MSPQGDQRGGQTRKITHGQAPPSHSGTSYGGEGGLAGQEPPETWCRPTVSERDRQAHCILQEKGPPERASSRLGDRPSWCLTRPPFHQHNSEACSEREEQHQLVGHDEKKPRRRRVGLPADRAFPESLPLREGDQQARSVNRGGYGWLHSAGKLAVLPDGGRDALSRVRERVA
jgi:hypothetical protein